MAKIKINLAGGELTIEFSDMKDLEEQLEKIDLSKIDTLLSVKKSNDSPHTEEPKNGVMDNDSKTVNELGTINILKISNGGEDAVKLAIFLASSGLSREEIKKITGITILSS